MKYTKRGLRQRRGTNSWEVTLNYKDPVTGELRNSYHTVTASTRKKAEKLRDQLILDLERKGSAFASDMTIKELLDELIDHKERSHSVEDSTLYGYRKDARFACRYIGGEQVSKVTVATIERMIGAMAKDGYSPRSIAKPFGLLKQAFKYAKAHDYVTKNPCDYCKPPKRERKALNILPKAERQRMLKAAGNMIHTQLGTAIELALTTGMRRGEVCGLRWSDFDEHARTISVNRSIAERSGGVYAKEPKTRESLRTIPLTPIMYEHLRAKREDSRRILHMLGVGAVDSYILGTQEPESSPYRPGTLSREFSAFCKANDFSCAFHDLRHTFATMLISEGADIRTVASYLGHANVAMTLNTYAEADPEAKLAAVDKIITALDIPQEVPIAKQPDSASLAAQLEDVLEQLRAAGF